MFDQTSIFMTLLPWVVGSTAAFIALFIFLKVWRVLVTHKVNSIGVVPGMQMSDLERMRKEGQISEDEFRRIRTKLAQREMASTQTRERIEKERALMAQVEQNPELARQLITPAPARSSAASSPLPRNTPAPPAHTPQQPTQEPAADTLDWETLVDPLSAPVPPKTLSPQQASAIKQFSAAAQPASPSSPPAMNMVRVAQARQEAARPREEGQPPAAPRDLDVLLAKGAITHEEYDRLRQFFG